MLTRTPMALLQRQPYVACWLLLKILALNLSIFLQGAVQMNSLI
uniref:Uncharacterized protein n=1 Tax=Solanum lycopersicum TaxID=4081 RepID=A0A3Q7JLN7_SOLLC